MPPSMSVYGYSFGKLSSACLSLLPVAIALSDFLNNRAVLLIIVLEAGEFKSMVSASVCLLMRDVYYYNS